MQSIETKNSDCYRIHSNEDGTWSDLLTHQIDYKIKNIFIKKSDDIDLINQRIANVRSLKGGRPNIIAALYTL